jgi:putative phosphoribosyl transferase
MDERSVTIPIGNVQLQGDLNLPERMRGLVLFAHGSGSSRLSPRNRFVANVLGEAGLATLLIDLLTEEEERIDATTGALRFDIGFLAGRLMDVNSWLTQSGVLTRGLGLGLFGSSTGAAAALVAAAEMGSIVGAVVSRGGRPDLAGAALSSVTAPTLLIVGGRDLEVLRLNREALDVLDCSRRLEVVPGATHLFEEPGTLERVAVLARNWFTEQLAGEAVTLPTGEPARPS